MSEGRTTIPSWELRFFKAMVEGQTMQERRQALLGYLNERERRKRYARVRSARDRERRTLVGAHMNREDAEMIRFFADRDDVSVTSFVKHALRQAMENSDFCRENGGWAAIVRRP